MAKPQITKEALRAMANLSGLEISDQQMEELQPQVQRVVEGLEGLDVLNLEEIEPAVVFKPETE